MSILRVTIEPVPPGPPGDWIAVNDGVMGGVSSGRVARGADGSVRLSGEVSLDNGGGFASARRPVAGALLARATTIALRVRGDGKRYKLTVFTDAAASGFQYQSPFETRIGESITLALPLAAFRAVFRGRPVPDAPPLAPERIRALGVIISDRQQGPFELTIESLTIETPTVQTPSAERPSAPLPR